MISFYLYRLAGFLCPLLPARFGYWLFARLGDIAFLLASRRQNTYFENLRRVLGDSASSERTRAIARRGFENLLKNYFDLFRSHTLTGDQLRAQLASVEGLEYLEEAIRQGKGVIAGSGHFGTWDIILHMAPLYLNREIIAPNERLKPEILFQYVMRLRRSQGIEIVPIDKAPRLLIQALRAGKVAGLAFDRDITESGPIVKFFGGKARLPDGAVQLSLRYGAPVVIGFSVRQPDNRSRVFIEPPLTFEKTGNEAKDICAGVQRIAAILEKYIRQYPDQWLMFQKVWLENQ